MSSREKIESKVAGAIRRFSFVQLASMRHANAWGDAGRERTLNDFSRHFFGISPDEETNPFEASQWSAQIEKELTPYLALSATDLQKELAEAGVEIEGHWFAFNDTQRLNEALSHTGTSARLFYGRREQGLSLVLFGPAREEHIGGMSVATLEREIARTPTAILPLVAFIQRKNSIVIRREALATIFTQKWRWTLDHPISPYADPAARLGDTLKQLTLRAYGASKPDLVDSKRSLIVDEMVETTKVHEICHGVIADAIQDNDLFDLVKLIRRYPFGRLIEMIDEALAEWMPEQNGHTGPMVYLARLAPKDPVKAKRVLLRYLSDSWFLGNRDQEYLTLMTDFFASSVIRFGRPGGQFDYEAMEKEAPRFYNALMARLQKTIGGIIEILKNATYVAQGFRFTFDQVVQSQKQYLSQRLAAKNEMHLFNMHLWANLLRYAEGYSPGTFRQIENFMIAAENEMRAEWLKLLNPSSNGNDLRGYLLKQSETVFNTPSPAPKKALPAKKRS